MKITYMSDLHLEFSEILETQALARLPEGDVLVLAGDICTLKKIDNRVYFPKVLKIARERFKHILAVAGNHEYYGSSINDTDKLRKFYDENGVKFLDSEHIEIDSIDFYGGAMWTDMNNDDPDTHAAVNNYMNDFHVIKDFSTYKAYQLHKKFLENMGEPDVVISHHAPHEFAVDPRYADEGLANYGYYSNVDIPKSVQIWIHGHVHRYYKEYLGSGMLLTANSRGYPGEEVYKNFKFDRTVEIK